MTCFQPVVLLLEAQWLLKEQIIWLKNISNMPVRLGVPNQISGLEELVAKPECATGVGLLVWGSKNAVASKIKKFVFVKLKYLRESSIQ